MSRTVGKDFDVRVAVVVCVCGGRRDGSHVSAEQSARYSVTEQNLISLLTLIFGL